MEKDDRCCGSWRHHDRDGHGIEEGEVNRIVTSLQCHQASHCKSRTLCDQMYSKIHLVTPIAKVHQVTPISKVHLVTSIAKVHLVTPIAIVYLVTQFAKAHPVVCMKDKFSIDLVKIWSKSVDWFKRYSKNQYIGRVDQILRNLSGLNGQISYKFCENLE